VDISESHARELDRQRRRKEALRRACAEALPAEGAIVFEPGCGHGHWLTAYAADHPDKTCVGIDLVSLRIRRALTKAAKRELPGLHFFKAELGEFLDVLPVGLRFELIVFLFPDPWPKKRHHRRRMIQTASLSRLAERTVPGSRLCFRTDDHGYFEWALEHLEAHPGWEIDPAAPWPHETGTYFQNFMDRYDSLVARRA
jgi:tRNA (guanine-N7-)-methyltransferase